MIVYTAVIFAILLILFLVIKVRVKFYFEMCNCQMTYYVLCILPFGLRLKIFPRKRRKKQDIKFETSYQNKEQIVDFKILQAMAPIIWQTFWRFFSGVTCTELYWNTKFGTGQANETAQIYGVLSGVKYTFVTFMMKHLKFKTDAHICITPFFTDKHFHMIFSCMLQFRIGYAIYVALLFFKAVRNQGKDVHL